ncbi:helix-turn-helix domain-containing protein [Streptomyces sp. NPDC001793]|uniref:helix-turn-helix domain-containing protein n=1 Tax=Streptomyces sp. NPDC001793 TaxID=3154657 RepID=UPI00332764AF
MKRLLERFEISTTTLYPLLRRHRVPLRAPAYPDSASRRAAAEYGRLRSDGMTHREIAEKFGITPNTLYRALRRHR